MQDDAIRNVPKSLQHFFIIHFAIDMIFAVPLFLFPTGFLKAFGWDVVDPITARLVAAALFGIGIESLIGKKAGPTSYKQLLNLKIIWSSFAVAAILFSAVQMNSRLPAFAWIVLAIFAAFDALWIYWRVRINS